MGVTQPNCKVCLTEKQSPEKWTCPCGLGYWNAVKKEFITGGRVRAKQIQNKEQYLEHLENCKRCRQKATDDGMVYFKQGFFLPRDDIPLEFVEEYVLENVDPSSRVQKATESIYGITTPGYLVFTQNKPPKSIITDLISRIHQDKPTLSTSTSAHSPQFQPQVTSAETRSIGSGLSTTDTKGEFKLHVTYNRFFRDYSEDGATYRQWDNDEGAIQLMKPAPNAASGYPQSIESQTYSLATLDSATEHSGPQDMPESGGWRSISSHPSQSPQESPTYHAPYELPSRPYQNTPEEITGKFDDLSVHKSIRGSKYQSNEQDPRKQQKRGRTPGKGYDG